MPNQGPAMGKALKIAAWASAQHPNLEFHSIETGQDRATPPTSDQDELLKSGPGNVENLALLADMIVSTGVCHSLGIPVVAVPALGCFCGSTVS